MSRQTLAATVPLSPVMILTVTPRDASRAIDVPASGLGRSTKVRNPTRRRSVLGSSPAPVRPSASRSATATTRAPSANSRSRVVRRLAGNAEQRARTASGAPLTTSVVRPPRRASTEASWRSWSKGTRVDPFVRTRAFRLGGERRRVGRPPQRLVQRVPADGSVVGDRRLVAHQAEEERARVGRSRRTERAIEGDRPLGQGPGLVGEQHPDVAEVLDGHQALHEDPLAGEGPRPARQAHADDRRQELRRDADGDGEGEQQRVDERPREARG